MACLRLRCLLDLEVANWRDVSGGCLDRDLANAAKDLYDALQKFEGIQRFTTVSGLFNFPAPRTLDLRIELGAPPPPSI